MRSAGGARGPRRRAPGASRSVAHRVNAERVVLLGWSRAILLQLAHPLVAAGVHQHSDFRATPWAAAIRLHHTVRAMLALSFGDPAAWQATIDTIRGIHRRVHGTLAATAGPFAAGTRYSAEDPDLVLWVHATLLESVPLYYELLVGPLTPAERDAYCAEAAGVAVALGAREADIPRTWGAVRAHLERGYASGAIVVSADAREVGHALLRPRLHLLTAPATWINRLLTLGLLPPTLRAAYGFIWTDRDERALVHLVPVLRAVRRGLPGWIACWPESRASN